MKKFLSVLLAVVMIASISAVATFAADPAFVASAVTGTAGSEVDVTISFENNPGTAAAKISVAYDPALTLVKTAAGPVMTKSGTAATESPDLTVNPYLYVWVLGTKETAENGVFSTMTFKIPEGAAADTKYDIKVTYSADDTYNLAEEAIAYTTVDGSITVVGAEAAVIDTLTNLPAAGDLTLDDKEAVDNAKTAYDALTPDEQAKVPAELVTKLNDAIAAIAALEAAATDTSDTATSADTTDAATSADTTDADTTDADTTAAPKKDTAAQTGDMMAIVIVAMVVALGAAVVVKKVNVK